MGESAAGAAPRLAVRQLEGRIGADSAASYVDLGRRASTHAHSVELASLHDYTPQTRIPQPADMCLACRFTHRRCCRCYAHTVECWGPRLHARPSTAVAAAHWPRLIAVAAAQYSRRRCCCCCRGLSVGLCFLIL